MISARGIVGRAGLGVCLLGLTASLARAVVVRIEEPFSVSFYNNGEADGSGAIGQQDWTSQQIDDVLASIRTWSGQIANAPGRRVEMHAFWTNYSGATIGNSQNPWVGSGGQARTFAEYVWRDGVNFSRPGGYYYDTRLTYDIDAAGFSWNFGGSPSPSTNVDFRSVVTHEVGHTLGFFGTYQSANDTWWAGGISAFDSFLRDDATNRPAAGSTGSPGNFNQLDDPVWFVGANAVASNGGQQVAIYAPAIYSSGSSLAHLDETAYAFNLMSPSIAVGETTRSVSNLEWGVMKDLGWQVVPEPMTTALLLAGAAALYVRRRRHLRPPPRG